MPLEDIQKDVDDWAKQFDPSYWPPLAQMAHLTEEVGEVAREINHLYGTKKKKQSEQSRDLGRELVEAIFTICCIANNSGINLQEYWTRMMSERQYGRDNERFDRIT